MLKKVKEVLQKELEEYALKVNEAILKDDFELYERKYQTQKNTTIYIEVLGNIVEIWNANDARDTGIWKAYVDEKDLIEIESIVKNRIKFKIKPEIVRQKIRALCEEKKRVCPMCGRGEE